MQFSDRQPQIYDRGDYGCSKFQFVLNSSKMGIFVPKCCAVWKRFLRQRIFRQAKIKCVCVGGGVIPHPCFLPCYDASDGIVLYRVQLSGLFVQCRADWQRSSTVLSASSRLSDHRPRRLHRARRCRRQPATLKLLTKYFSSVA